MTTSKNFGNPNPNPANPNPAKPDPKAAPKVEDHICLTTDTGEVVKTEIASVNPDGTINTSHQVGGDLQKLHGIERDDTGQKKPSWKPA